MLASSSMVCTAARTPTLATTVCPVLLATQDPSRLAEVWSRLLLKNRQVQSAREQKKLDVLTKRDKSFVLSA